MIALVPAFNEEGSVGYTVAALRRSVEGVEVFVADDGSKDHTVAEAEEAGATVISMTRNVGKGGALNRVFSSVVPDDDDLVLLIDADLGSTAGEAVKLVEPVLRGHADMAIARFGKARKKGGFGIVKGLARWGIRRLGGMEAATPLSGQRAMRAGVFRAVGGMAPGYGMEVALTIDALRAGYKVVEVSCDMTHNETGRDVAGFKHRGKQFLAVAWALIRRL